MRKKYFHFIYITIIVLLVTAVVLLTVNKKEAQELDPVQQYYQNKCNSFAFQNFNLSKDQVVFIGDSITDLYPLDDYYADLNVAVYNRGIGADTTSGVLKRLKVSLFDIKPSKIVLLIGTNDINGNVENSKIIANYSEILNKIKEELPSTYIYCVSIPPQNLMLESYSNFNVEETTKTILEINTQIKNIVKDDPNITYIDLFSHLADCNNMLIEKYSDDGIHLNANGFEVWTNLIKPYL